MKPEQWIPCVALAAMTLVACDDDRATGIVTTNSVRVRFVNAISDANGSVLLTSNGTVIGTAQPFGTGSATCATIGAGANRQLRFGTANAGGTAIASELGTLTTSLASGGNFTILATGTTADPRLLVLDNNTTTAITGNANVRLVNATTIGAVDFFATPSAVLGTPTSANIAARAAGSFAMIPITNSTLTFANAGSTTPIFTSTGTFNAGQNYTVVLLEDATGGFETLTLAGC